jgi:hypothetical protein
VGPQSHTPYSCSQAPHTRGHMLFNGYWERQTEFMDFLSRFNCPAAWLHPEFSITMDPLRIYFRSHRYRTSWMKIPAQLGKIRQKCLELSRHHADYYIIFFRTLHTVFFFFLRKALQFAHRCVYHFWISSSGVRQILKYIRGQWSLLGNWSNIFCA